jgi:predicted peptidase
MARIVWVTVIGVGFALLASCAVEPPQAVFAASTTDISTGFLDKAAPVDGKAVRYALYVPEDYTPDKAWPLIVFLHGSGERGNDNLKQTDEGIGHAIRLHRERFPALVLMPQCPDGEFWDKAVPAIEAAMAQVQSEYSVDPKAITLTGLSLGGYATWIWGAAKTDTFAALMPICGGGDPADVLGKLDEKQAATFGTMEERVKALSAVPIWAFHGADDDVVPPERSREMVKRVKDAGGHVKYDELKDTNHNSWDAAYGDEKAIKWLLKQRKK